MAESTIPKRLKAAREESGLSQKVLGIRAGFDEFVASARMNQYERGVHTPNFSTVERIAAVLKVDAAYFYCRDEALARIIKNYSQSNRQKKKKILQSAE